MILVIGATGLLGMEVCRALRQRGKEVRALVRSTASGKATQLASEGVKLAVGDLKDPESLAHASRGVSAVISTASSTLSRQAGDSIETVDRLGQRNAVDAARSVGVSRFVFVSIPVELKFPSPLTTAKREVEQHLVQSGLPYTILRANSFMEVWLSPMLGFDYPNHRARIYGAGSNPVSFVSYKDVAQFAVQSVGAAAAANRALDVCGPEPVSQLDAVRIFERATGREFALEYVTEESLHEQRNKATDPMDQTFASLMLDYAAGGVADPTESLKVVPLQLTTVGDYANHVMAARR
jgi:NADH dehydrogenase